MEKTVKNKVHVPHGAIKDIAKRADVSIYTVSNVIRGKSQNRKVLEAIRDYLAELNTVKNDIQELSNQD